jgi:acyl-CoA reductase-like NAD-dependent aldehyde dehydrogenase
VSINEQMVQDIVQDVLAKMQIASDVQGDRGVFKDMNEAIEAAKASQKIVAKMSLDHREKVISNIRKKIMENAEILARMGVQETGMGNVGHKILKHQLVAEKTPGTEDITTQAWSGDRGLTLIEMGPFGVIGAITPCTNPSETVLCNTIGMFAGGKLNRKCVGRDAKTLLGMIGVTVPDNIRCITFEGPKEHPLIATELMMPILGVVRAKDFDDAVEQAVWLEHGNRHSAHIHSKNVDRITKYAKAIDTAILVKNGPSYAALGFGGEGFCTFTIASRTGEGLTSASSFTKRRRCVMTDSLCIR